MIYMTFEINMHHVYYDDSTYAYLGENDCYSTNNSQVLHKVCHYSKFTLVEHQLNWW